MSDADQSGAGRREVAYRLFAAEYDDADLSYSEGEEERAPNYVVTPTGARVNRTFVVGVLTEVETVSEDVLRARVVDPTGAFVLYAGQYQPDEQAFLDTAEPPTFVAVTGKARTFQPEDSEQVYTSIRPESINEVDADTRDRWTVGTAQQTLRRVETMATALSLDQRGEALRAILVEEGVDEGLAAGVALAIDHYGTSPAYLRAVREIALDAARLVAGDLDEVEPVSLAPDAPGEADLDALAGEVVSAAVDAPTDTTADAAAVTASDESTEEASAGTAETASGEGPSETGPADAADTDEGTSDDVGDFEPGEFELDEEEREEIEEEFGTEFQTGSEVDEPGEADIETSAAEGSTADESAAGADVEASKEVATADADVETSREDAAAGEEAEAGKEKEGAAGEDVEASKEDAGSDEELDAGIDLEDATVEMMGELDDGGGADREAVVEAVVERYGADRDEVEDAIQDALMDGRCYEPDDATLKPI